MFYASDIIGKKVISLFESNQIGCVSNLYLNKNRTKIVLLEILTNSDEKVFINTNNVYCVGESVAIKSEENCISKNELDGSTFFTNLINKQVYFANGDYVGTVSDICLKNFWSLNYVIIKKENISLTNEFLDITNTYKENSLIDTPLQNCNDHSDTLLSSVGINEFIRFGDCLLLNDKNKKIKFSNLKPKIKTKPNYESRKVYVLNNNNENQILNSPYDSINEALEIDTQNDLTNDKQNNYKAILAPINVLSNNYDFLIGRKVNKNIFANNKELIIKKNFKIMHKHIELASTYNKLRELVNYSI